MTITVTLPIIPLDFLGYADDPSSVAPRRVVLSEEGEVAEDAEEEEDDEDEDEDVDVDEEEDDLDDDDDDDDDDEDDEEDEEDEGVKV